MFVLFAAVAGIASLTSCWSSLRPRSSPWPGRTATIGAAAR